MADDSQIEQERAYQSALLRAQQLQLRQGQHSDLIRDLTKIKAPSRIVYYGFFSLAAASDIVDIVENFALVASAGSSALIDIFIAIAIAAVFIFIGWMENRKLKHAGKALEAVGGQVELVEQRIKNYRQVYAGMLRAGRKVKAFRKPLRSFALAAKKYTNFLSKTKGSKYLRGPLLQIIPIIDLWPWQVQAIHSLYKARKSAHEQAQEAILLLEEAYKTEQLELRELQLSLREAA